MKTALKSTLALAAAFLMALLVPPAAQSATYTWTNNDDGVAVANGNWSSGTSWSAVPVSAADTTLSFGYTFNTNSTAETNTLTNDVANPFLLNVLTLGGNNPAAGSGSFVATINIAGSPLEFVSNVGTTPQVNLNANRSPGQLVTFNVQTNLILTNDTLFTGNGTATFNITGGISGAGNFAKGGTSFLTLSGTNSYAGTTTISGGTLHFTNQVSLYNNNTASWTAANIIVANGATLSLNVGGANQFTGASVTTLLNNLSGANGSSTTGFAAGSTIALDTTGASTTVSGNIVNSTGTGGGALSVTKRGTNTLTLTGANTYTGTTTLNAGTLTLNPGANAQTIGNIALAHTGTDMVLNLDGTNTGNTAGTITQTGTASNGQRTTINKLSVGIWTVGDVTGVGTSRIILQPQAGILSIGQIVSGVDLRMSSTGTLQLRTAGNHGVGLITGGLSGTIDNSSGSLITFNVNPAITFNGNFTLAGSSLNMGTGLVSLVATRQVTVSNAASTLTFGGAVSGTGFGITKAGAGILTLTNSGTNYTGATTISTGTLALAGSTLGAQSFASAVTVNANTTMEIRNTAGSASYAAIGGTSLIGTLTYNSVNQHVVIGSSANNTGAVTVSGGASVINISPTGTFATNSGGLFFDGGLKAARH